MKRLDYYWYTRSTWLILLTPLSLFYRLVVWLRRNAYRSGILSSYRLAKPVIVVGNLTAGGTGKTPLVAWLAGYLMQKGFRPGIVARGYGGKASSWPQQVRPDSDPGIVGDEAVMLAEITGCPMAVAPNRVAAARELLDHSDCDVIISDDGLQHYALQRDLEIAVIDGVRRFGVGFLLPAGPLREPLRRLREVDLVVVNGLAGRGEYPMRLLTGKARGLGAPHQQRELGDFRGQSVHAVAGIGNPARFFQALQQHGMRVEEHAFPDHHRFQAADIQFGDDRPVFMTEKDAVKCRQFACGKEWVVPVRAYMSKEFCARLDALLDSRLAVPGESLNS
jgi:tetraacyldisaccharide 4'-kinase